MAKTTDTAMPALAAIALCLSLLTGPALAANDWPNDWPNDWANETRATASELQRMARLNSAVAGDMQTDGAQALPTRPSPNQRRDVQRQAEQVWSMGAPTAVSDGPPALSAEGLRELRGVTPQATRPGQQERRYEGRVESRMNVREEQTGEMHTVALVRAPGGEAILVDLGLAHERAQAKALQSRDIVFVGRLAWIDGEKVVIASHVGEGTDRVEVVRPGQQPYRDAATGQSRAVPGRYASGGAGRSWEEAADSPQAPVLRMAVIGGQVLSTVDVRADGRPSRRLVVLSTEFGERVTVDLGIGEDVKEVQAGDRLVVQGAPLQVDGDVIVMAAGARINGQPHSIHRPLDPDERG